MIGRISAFWYPITFPSTRASPQEGFKSVDKIFIVVVFPAPFGPMKP